MTLPEAPTAARIVVAAGARPNFMKVAPVLRALARVADRLRADLVHTGQHYDDGMSAVFFEQLAIPEPHASLRVGSGSHAVQTARVLIEFEQYLVSTRPTPAGVVVVGDVNSTLACALAAAKCGIPVAHVEAGLRSFDRSMPEEINRVVTDAVASLLLVTESSGEENLRREGVDQSRIRFVGNVMIDSLVHELPVARTLGLPARLGLTPGRFALVTLHRPSNVDEAASLGAIVGLLTRTAARVDVVFPMHPRTRARLEAFGLMARLSHPRLQLLEPLAYRDMLALMDTAAVVVTDSGGVQEETSYLGTPCVTLRERTERPITVTGGTNILVGHDLDCATRVIDRIIGGDRPQRRAIPGWDGQAAGRIVEALLEAWG